MAILQGARITGSIIATQFIKASSFSGSLTSSKLYVQGSVGIGTTSPAYKLDVNSSIVSRSTLSSPRFSSAGTYVYGVTNSPTWTTYCASYTNNNVTAPDGTTTAGTYTLTSTCAAYDLYQTIAGLTSGRVYTVGMWVKLGTATNFCLVVNNSSAWNTIGGKAFTSSDGLSTGKWTHISYTFAGPATGQINLHLGYHAETAVTQQTAGTVFLWNIEMTELSSTWISNVEDEIRLPGSSIWTSRGSVGIGTTSPASRLQIGNLSSTSTATPETLSLGGTYSNSAGSNVKLRVYDDGSSIGGMSVSSGQMEINTWSSGKIAFYRGTSQVAIFDNIGLGVGTSSPAYKLDVAGDTFDNSFRVYANNNSGPAVTIQNSASGGKAWHLISNGTSNADGAGRLQYWNSTDSFTAFTLGYTSSTISNLYTPLYVSGNVGIGTTSPGNLLHVYSTTSETAIKVTSTASSGDAALYLQAFNATPGNNVISFGDTASSGVGQIIYQHSNDSMQFKTNSSERMRIDSNGNVGIGTTTVSSKLHVYDNGGSFRTDLDSTYHMGMLNEYVSTYVTRTKFGRWNSTSNLEIYYDIANTEEARITRNLSTAVLKFNRSTNTDMIIDGSGNVGIGTTSIYQLLTVNGIIEAGANGTTTGGPVFYIKYNGAGNDYINSIGSEYSSGNTILGYGATGKSSAAGYVSTFDNFSSHRGALNIGAGTLNFLNSRTSLSTTVGSDVPMTSSFYIASDGNVGIGTTSPNAKLNINTGGSTGGIIINTGAVTTSAYVRLVNSSQNWDLNTQTNNRFAIYDQTYAKQPFTIEPNTPDNTIWLNASGYVGVGTSSPSNTKLHIVGDWVSGHSTVKIQTITSFASGGTAGIATYDSDGTRSGYLYSYTTGTSVGSSNAKPLIFETNGTEKVRIDTNGNLGIGTTSPSVKLDVIGGINSSLANNFNISSGPYNAYFYNSSTSTSDYNAIRISQGASGAAVGYFGTGGSATGNTSFRNTFVVGTQNSTDFVLNTADTERVRITSAGSVGIGTSNPTNVLTVYNSTTPAIDLNADTSTTRGRISATSADITITALTSSPIIFKVDSSEKVRITANGNVGIGTTTVATKLHLQSADSATTLRIDNSNSSNDAAILLTDSNNPTGEGLRVTYDSSVGDTYFNNIYPVSTNAFHFQKGDFGSGTELLIIKTDGNVGIGTTTVSSKLHVYDNGGSFRTDLDSTYHMGMLNEYVSTYVTRTKFGRWNSTSNLEIYYDIANTEEARITRNLSTAVLKFNRSTNTDMIIDGSGNVGIGTTSPAYKFHISGSGQTIASINSSTTTNVSQLQLKANGDGVLIMGMFGSAAVGTNYGVTAASQAYIGTTTLGSNHPSSLVISTASTIPVIISTNNTEKVRITANGNVGIGTSSPQFLLDVISASTTHWLRLGNGGSNSGAGLILAGSSTTKNWIISNQYNVNGALEFTQTTAPGSSTIASSPAMMINSDGNVGIGTTSPANKLHVSGSSTNLPLKLEGLTSNATGYFLTVDNTTGVVYKTTGGASGTAGTSGTSGANGSSGVSGTSGANGTSGTSGTSVGGSPVRAYVYFNGTGTVAINGSNNVSSITDNGTGDYTVNFTTAFVDAYYTVAGTCTLDFTNATSIYNVGLYVPRQANAQVAGSCRLACEYITNTLYDCVAVRAEFVRA